MKTFTLTAVSDDDSMTKIDMHHIVNGFSLVEVIAILHKAEESIIKNSNVTPEGKE